MAVAQELVDRALALATAADRPDLGQRLALAGQRLADPRVRVIVVGEAGKGKSSLVNGLVGAPVCPVSDEVRTPVPTLVRFGPEPRAGLVLAPAGAPVDPATPVDPSLPAGVGPQLRPVPVERVAGLVALGTLPDQDQQLVRAEVELPRQLLGGGLELMDTAGLGGVGTGRSGSALELVPRADAVLVVTDASQEFTAPEMAFLRQAAALCPTLACVVSKIDAAPDWRRIVELDAGHLRRQGIDAPTLPVSAALASLAVRTEDRELYDESGIAVLIAFLLDEVLSGRERLARRAVVNDVTGAAEHLGLALRSELAALVDPAGREALVSDLEAARAAIEDLRRNSARWQQLLADGITDLMADIDHDLRDRSRVVVREAEAAIDNQDPGPLWPEIAGWVEQLAADAVADSYIWAEQRSQWLAEQVIQQFSDDGGAAVPELSVGSPADLVQSLTELPDLDAGGMSLRSRLLIGLRGSYSGVLMTGLVTSLAGMAMINPISVAAGVLIGRKVYQDDREQRLQRRRAEAKSLVRRHLDEVVFQAGKQLKDRLRLVQRTLRDLISDTVDEMSRSMTEALKATQRTTTEASAARDARLREVRRLLEQVDRLAADARRLDDAAVPAP